MSQPELIIVTEEEITGSRGSWGEKAQEAIRRLREVKLDPQVLEARMSDFLQVVGRLFQKVDEEISPQSALQLEEVELSIEIGTEGEIKLVAGGKASGKGAITLKFKRPAP